MKKMRGFALAEFSGSILGVGLLIFSLGGWITHVVFCLSHGRWGFLVAGALVFPIAIIHGWMIWLGFAH